MLSKEYRPSTFFELVGQENNSVIMKEMLKEQLFDFPLLFTGPYGSGKTSASRVFSKAVLCQNITTDFEPCCKCQSCLDFQDDRNINYTEIDAASNGDVESIRNLRESTSYASVGGKYKITNIDEAHNITKAGYNALLKQLEEGHKHHIFIFCTNEPEKLLGTVRSRCVRIHSQAVSPESLAVHLKHVVEKEQNKNHQIDIDDDALNLIAEVTAPHIRDALNTLDFLSYKGKIIRSDIENYFQIADQNLFLELFINIKDNLGNALSLLDKMADRYDIDVIFSKMAELCITFETKIKGVEYQKGYLDKNLFDRAVMTGIDFLAMAGFLLKVERPLDLIYIRYLIAELNRITNNESTLSYDMPNKMTVNIPTGVQVIHLPEKQNEPEEKNTAFEESDTIIIATGDFSSLSNEKASRSYNILGVTVKDTHPNQVKDEYVSNSKNFPVSPSEARNKLDKEVRTKDETKKTIRGKKISR